MHESIQRLEILDEPRSQHKKNPNFLRYARCKYGTQAPDYYSKVETS